MFRIILVLLLLLPANVFAYECTKEIDLLSKESKIKVSCDPSKTYNYSSNITGTRASNDKLDIFYPYLKKFIVSYDTPFLRKHIEEIILVENLRKNEIDIGGLSDGRKIFVCLDNYSGDLTEVYLRILHHEFSSDVFKANEYELILNWKSFSREKYNFTSEFNRRCLNNFYFAYDYNESINSDGFIYNYGKTNEENDFNTYAETLFIRTDFMKSLKSYPKINKKLQLFKQFYRNAGFKGKFPDETWQITIAGLV